MWSSNYPILWDNLHDDDFSFQYYLSKAYAKLLLGTKHPKVLLRIAATTKYKIPLKDELHSHNIVQHCYKCKSQNNISKTALGHTLLAATM